MAPRVKPLKKSILFDAGPVIDNAKTGIGYYASHTIDALASRYGEDILLEGYYFNFLGRRDFHLDDSRSATLKFKEIKLFPSKLLSLCRRIGVQPPLRLLLRGKYDHVFFTNYLAMPLPSSTHVSVFVYDLGFLDCPDFLQEANLKVLRRFCPPSIERANTIVTISEFTKERILHYFPNTKANIVVTPIPPLATKNIKVSLNQRLKSLGVRKKKYILYLGTLEPRKNIAQLVRAYSQLPTYLQSDYSLVLAGGRGWKDEEITVVVESAKESGLPIIQTGYVTDEEKASLYSQAACFVLPSHYEGFGMPILEAMSYDTPVVVSDIPVFREVAKDAVIYFDKDNESDIAAKLAIILSDDKVQKELQLKADLVLLNTGTWQNNADKIMEAITYPGSP
jgi:glycosyltransferase involved in cell wall biosynthesis